jgi:hypothetical protein
VTGTAPLSGRHFFQNAITIFLNLLEQKVWQRETCRVTLIFVPPQPLEMDTLPFSAVY